MKRFNCPVPGCPNTVDTNGDYCYRHKKTQAIIKREEKKAIVKRLDSLDAPGRELFNSPEWRILRQNILKDQPYCEYCGGVDRLEIHHIQKHYGDKQLFFNRSNLIVLCHDCHNKITMQQVRAGKNKDEAPL